MSIGLTIPWGSQFALGRWTRYRWARRRQQDPVEGVAEALMAKA
jgi:hypothetical protein